MQLGSFDWQCLLGNYAKFARFASIDYNNNNYQSSPAAVVVVVAIVFVGLRRFWDLFLKIFIDFGFGFRLLPCAAFVGCFGSHLLPLLASSVGSVD